MIGKPDRKGFYAAKVSMLAETNEEAGSIDTAESDWKQRWTIDSFMIELLNAPRDFARPMSSP